MLSIIICSKSKEQLDAVSVSIAETIGAPYEIIPINNEQGVFSLTKAYNLGASTAKYEVLCFIHEDILFRTAGWGLLLVDILKDHTIGLVGVAGGVHKPLTPGPAWWSPLEGSSRMNIIQHYEDGSSIHKIEVPSDGNMALMCEVVSLDGVFLGCRKAIWKEFLFDEFLLKGFHFYDMDFTFSVRQKYRAVVVYNILLEHFSNGRIDNKWAVDAGIMAKKWRTKLPASVVEVEKSLSYKVEKSALDFYLHTLFETGCDFSMQVKFVLSRCFSYPGDIRGNIFFLKRLFKTKNIYGLQQRSQP